MNVWSIVVRVSVCVVSLTRFRFTRFRLTRFILLWFVDVNIEEILLVKFPITQCDQRSMQACWYSLDQFENHPQVAFIPDSESVDFFDVGGNSYTIILIVNREWKSILGLLAVEVQLDRLGVLPFTPKERRCITLVVVFVRVGNDFHRHKIRIIFEKFSEIYNLFRVLTLTLICWWPACIDRERLIGKIHLSGCIGRNESPWEGILHLKASDILVLENLFPNALLTCVCCRPIVLIIVIAVIHHSAISASI